MIDEELAREAIGQLGTAAAMLLEDAHLELVTSPADIDTARAVAVTLQRVGADVDALGAAAAVLAQRSKLDSGMGSGLVRMFDEPAN